VKSAGFDAVILHGAHGYLLSEFFSPRSNRREDEYGGSLENRARLALEAVRAVREAVGEDYIVGYRLSADECVPGGFTIEDSLWLAGELERAGVDWIDVSMGVYESGWRLTPLADAPTAANAEAAARIRKTVSIPISVVGRIVDPEVAKSVIASGAADFVTIGRALHADPDFARKASGEDSAPLRPCVSCMVCVDCRNENIPAVCSVNPMSGRATPARRKTANPRRRVAVVGGGLAGLQAAERAAEHGNDVVLFEAAEDLGGQLLWAARLPFMTDYSRIVAYFRRRLAELRVDIHLGSKADVETMRAVAPHAVVMATGAAPWIPAIPGLRERSCDTVATFDSERVSGPVMIIGGSIAGLAVGLAAARRGVAVDLVEQGSVWGFGGGAMLTSRLVEELKAIRAVTLRLATTVERIGVDGVELQNGGRRWIAPPAAHVVVARQMQSETRFADVYAGSAHGAPVFRAGDCVWPRRMADAVFEGASVVERWMAEA
jgi:NADPH-dependent 2,4-dienoyl-CoA reductase/sulfur reductase-like enzyme